jgi:hypothetical protein
MEVDYSVNRELAIDDSLREAIEHKRAGEPIRIRIQPQVYIRRPGASMTGKAGVGVGSYLAWKGLYWQVNCTTVEEGSQFRQALARFFGLLESHGLHAVIKVLDTLASTPVESPATHSHTA